MSAARQTKTIGQEMKDPPEMRVLYAMTWYSVWSRMAATLPLVIAGAVAFWLFFAGFSKQVDHAEFVNLMKSNLTRYGSFVIYKGRKNGFDYFERILSIGQRTRIHIPISESPIKDGYPYSSDSAKWLEFNVRNGPSGWERNGGAFAGGQR